MTTCFSQTEAKFKKGTLDLYQYFEKKVNCERPGVDNILFEIKILESGKVESEYIIFHSEPGNCKDEIIKAIKKMPKWNPAIDKKGNPIESKKIIRLNMS